MLGLCRQTGIPREFYFYLCRFSCKKKKKKMLDFLLVSSGCISHQQFTATVSVSGTGKICPVFCHDTQAQWDTSCWKPCNQIPLKVRPRWDMCLWGLKSIQMLYFLALPVFHCPKTAPLLQASAFTGCLHTCLSAGLEDPALEQLSTSSSIYIYMHTLIYIYMHTLIHIYIYIYKD